MAARAQVLLVTSRTNEPHVQAVLPKLRQRGADSVVFDPRDFPHKASIQARFGATGMSSARLRTQTDELELSELTSVWWRKPGQPGAFSPLTHDAERVWAQVQAQTFLNGVYANLACRWLPGRRSVAEVADLKAHQLALAAQVGLSVPDTLISNVPSDLLRFYERHEGRIVSKVLRDARIERGDETRLAYTHKVTRRDLLALDALSCAPVILQAYVPKKLELRLTVIGACVFAVALHTQQSDLTKHDSRHDDPSVRCEPYALDSVVERRCLALMAALDLSFATFDFVLTDAGEYVFLELNANGQWWWVEERTGLPIADALADWLTQPRVTHDDVAV